MVIDSVEGWYSVSPTVGEASRVADVGPTEGRVRDRAELSALSAVNSRNNPLCCGQNG